jgi:hypothetical protein
MLYKKLILLLIFFNFISIYSMDSNKNNKQNESNKENSSNLKIIHNNVNPKQVYYCRLCNYSCLSAGGYSSHIRGQLHRLNQKHSSR